LPEPKKEDFSVLRKTILAVAVGVMVMAGSRASGLEAIGLRVEAGVEIAHQGQKLVDNELDYDTMVFQPYLQVSRFGIGPCFSLRARALFGIDEDTTIDAAKFETSTSGWDVQALAGFGMELPLLKLTPLFGVSFRGMTAESAATDSDDKVDYDYEAFILEVGARAELELPVTGLRLTAQMTIGPVISGESTLDIKELGTDIKDISDIDFADGYHLELRVGLDYSLTDNVFLQVGLSYERFADNAEDFEDLDVDNKDELGRVSLLIGAAITF
jgi:hypothetical protein